jgi:hypothetical protein
VRDIPGHEGRYAATEDGRIWSHVTGGYLRPYKIGKTGYWGVLLGSRPNRKHHLVHRLVALTYIPQVPGKPEINHKDRNKDNNSAWNLEWVTHSENHKHRWATTPEEKRRKRHLRGKRMGIPQETDTGAYFPLRPNQKHLIPVFRALIDQVRGPEGQARAAAMTG